MSFWIRDVRRFFLLLDRFCRDATLALFAYRSLVFLEMALCGIFWDIHEVFVLSTLSAVSPMLSQIFLYHSSAKAVLSSGGALFGGWGAAVDMFPSRESDQDLSNSDATVGAGGDWTCS